MHPTLARIYTGRHVTQASELCYALRGLHPPTTMTGITDAVDLLEQALDADAKILFVGDFDADGATACAVGALALTRMGASDVGYLVPNRFEYGYGLSPEIVGVAAVRQPDVLITVDNGIASVDGVAVARELGMSVIITDHHLPGSELPAADVIVNPNLPGDAFPSKALSGVGVIFYVLTALRGRLREQGWFQERGIKEPNMAELLDLVAVGTVADLVPLDHNNRVLVSQGLARINAGRCRPGLQAILETGKHKATQVSARDLGFTIAPRLNAAGRLEDMSMGIECLLTEDIERAREIAGRLDRLNTERRGIESTMQQQATDIVRNLYLNGDLPLGLCLFDESWHQGIVGLVAARVREHTGRPVIALAPAANGILKGSARSVEGLHIRDLLDRIATRHPELLDKFGGHAMAAGLSLKRDALDRFRTAFSKAVDDHLNENALTESVFTDGPLEDDDLCIEFADILRRGGPWGQTFPEPAFDDVFVVLERRIVADRHLKLRVRRDDGSKALDAIIFGYLDHHPRPPEDDRMRLVYRLDINEYQGMRSPQLIIDYWEAC